MLIYPLFIGVLMSRFENILAKIDEIDSDLASVKNHAEDVLEYVEDLEVSLVQLRDEVAHFNED